MYANEGCCALRSRFTSSLIYRAFEPLAGCHILPLEDRQAPTHRDRQAWQLNDVISIEAKCLTAMMRCRFQLPRLPPPVRLLQLIGLDDSYRDAAKMIVKHVSRAFLVLCSLYVALAVYLHRLPPVHDFTRSSVVHPDECVYQSLCAGLRC